MSDALSPPEGTRYLSEHIRAGYQKVQHLVQLCALEVEHSKLKTAMTRKKKNVDIRLFQEAADLRLTYQSNQDIFCSGIIVLIRCEGFF